MCWGLLDNERVLIGLFELMLVVADRVGLLGAMNVTCRYFLGSTTDAT